MPQMVRVGLVGIGDIGRLHARALKKRPEVELCVCRGVNPGRAEALAAELGARLYRSYAEMLADPSVAAVDICVPNDLHREYTEQAASAGKHILCEKPIAMTLEDAEAMRSAAGRAGVLLMIAHPLRFWPEYIQARQVLQSGQLGACRAITMRRMLSLLISVEGEDRWRQKPERMGGAMLDLQIHDLDFLNWTFGLPDRVYSAAARSSDGGLNHTYTLFEYSLGITAMVESSYMLQGDPMIFSLKAVCEQGTLDYGLDLEHFDMHAMQGPQAGGTARRGPATLLCYRAGRQPEVLAHQEPDVLEAIFARELSYFVDCVTGKTENTVAPVAEAVTALKLALVARQSFETRAPVSLA